MCGREPVGKEKRKAGDIERKERSANWWENRKRECSKMAVPHRTVAAVMIRRHDFGLPFGSILITGYMALVMLMQLFFFPHCTDSHLTSQEFYRDLPPYFLQIPATTGLNANSASAFGMTISPLKKSDRDQTSSTFRQDPTTMKTTTSRE